jgi:hypothetical protein
MRSSGVTQLLIQWRNGDQAALNELLPHVYSELHRLARHYLRQERPGHTLQATALVHEAYMRLVIIALLAATGCRPATGKWRMNPTKAKHNDGESFPRSMVMSIETHSEGEARKRCGREPLQQHSRSGHP